MNLVKRFVTKNPCFKNNVNAKALYDSGQDKRYWVFQQRGPLGGMLHSVGCAQPSALVFIDNHWNISTQESVCVHGVIDANDGTAYQCLEWNYRGWHGGGSSNNTHIGVEMCESKYIRYMTPNEPGYAPGKFVILDKAKAQADCRRAYNTAVELFAMLAKRYKWNVDTDILSHAEGYKRGIASNHGDPEHHWKGLGMSYTMAGFRSDVKKAMEGEEMTEAKVKEIVAAEIQAAIKKAVAAQAATDAAQNNALKAATKAQESKDAAQDTATAAANSKLTAALNALTGRVSKDEANLPQSIAAKVKEINAEHDAALNDNDASKWSEEAREWAIGIGLVKGKGLDKNGIPNYAWEESTSLERMVTILYRLWKALTTTIGTPPEENGGE